jgi:hypothetical protein
MTVLAVLKSSRGAVLVDTLSARTGLTTGQVLGQLTLLELNGQAKSIGGRWQYVETKSKAKSQSKVKVVRRKASRVIPKQEKDDAGKIVASVQKFGRPLDIIQLEKETKLNGTRIKAALPNAKRLGLTETTTEGELLPRYGFDLFSAKQQAAVRPKKIVLVKAKAQPKATKSLKVKTPSKGKKCAKVEGLVKKIKIETVRYKDESGRFVCSPLKRTKERSSTLPVVRVGKVRTRRDGAVMIAYPDAMPDAKVSYKYRKRGKTIVGVSIVALRFTGELKKSYAEGIRSKDKQTRVSANLFKRTIFRDIQTELERELSRELASQDGAKAAKGVIGVQDFDYPALDLADASSKEAQSLTKAVNKYRGGSIKVRKTGKSYKAKGRGSMPFNDRTVNQVVAAEDIKYLAGDRSVSVLPSKRGK